MPGIPLACEQIDAADAGPVSRSLGATHFGGSWQPGDNADTVGECAAQRQSHVRNPDQGPFPWLLSHPASTSFWTSSSSTAR